MKRLTSLLVLLAFVIITAGCAATTEEVKPVLKEIKPLPVSERKTLAVIPYEFKDKNTAYEGLESGLVDLTIDSFFGTQKFLLVERTRLKAVIAELNYNSSGLVNTEDALQIGKQAGAQYVFIGTVASINPIADHKSLGVAYIDSKGFDVTIQGRIIDIERGVVIASSTGKGEEKQTKKVAFGATTGSIAPDDTLIKMAFEKAVENLTNDLASQF